MTLKKALASRNVDMHSLIEDWWGIFCQDETIALKEIIELIFHTAGYTSFVFTPDNFPTEEVQNQMNEKGDVSMFLEILSDDDTYAINYKSLFANLFRFKQSVLLYSSNFTKPVLDSVCTLIKGRWDSFRITSTITATELMSAIFKKETLLQQASIDTAESVNEVSAKKKMIGDLSHHLFCKVYRPSTKDQSRKVRKVAAKKLLEWTAEYPEKMLGSDWHLYLIRGIRDVNIEVREIVFMALHNLFAQGSEREKQQDLFFRTKSDLLAVVNSAELGEISMRILCCVIRFSDVMLNSYEREDLYVNIYNPKGSIACLAGRFLYTVYFRKCVSSPKATIYSLVQFNCESKHKSYSLLADAMYPFLHPHLEWKDWDTVIRKARPEEITEVVGLFFAYVSKAVVDYVPKFRKSIYKLSREEMIKNSKSFTEYFGPILIILLSDLKIKLKVDAFCKIIRLSRYFSADVEIQNIKDLLDVLCEVIKVSTNKEVIIECSSGVADLIVKCQAQDPTRAQGLKKIVNSLIQITVADFLDYLNISTLYENPGSIENRMVYLCAYHNFDDCTLWNILIDKLENSDRLSVRVVVTLISVLQQLMVRNVLVLLKKLDDQSGSESSQDDLLDDEFSLCLTRYLTLKTIIKKYLKPGTHDEIKNKAFSLMVGLLEVFGRHMSAHTTLSRFATGEDPDLVEVVIDCAVHRLMTKQCSTGDSYSKPDDCCIMLNKLCTLFSHSIISMAHVGCLLLAVGKNDTHNSFIVNMLKQHMTTSPNQWLVMTAGIFNALMNSLGNGLKEGKPLLESIKGLQDMLECILDTKKIDRTLLRPVVLKLYMEVVNRSVDKRQPFLPLLALLKTLARILSPSDIPHLLSTMRRCKVAQLDEHVALLESLQKDDNTNRAVANLPVDSIHMEVDVYMQ